MKCFRVVPEKLDIVLAKIEEYICDIEESLKFKTMLICEEVITNQLRHSDFGDVKADIEFCFDIEDRNSLSILFKDNAKEFNPLQKEEPDTTKSLEETELGGLGVFIVKKYSKNLSYEYKNCYNILKVDL